MSREQQGVILFLSLSLCLFFFLARPPFPGKGEISPHPGDRLLTQKATEGEFLVEVDGNVNQRGMVPVEAGMTVLDTIEKAGGIKGKISLPPEVLSMKIEKSSRLNIVAEEDGKGRVSLERLAPPKLKVLSVPLPINAATVEELDTLPGVGPKTARAIIEYREAYGKFASPEDLLQVPGIGPKKLDAIRPHIKVP